MTDKEEIEKLFNRLGIGYDTVAYPYNSETAFSLDVGNRKVTGDGPFETNFIFDKDGNFTEVAIND